MKELIIKVHIKQERYDEMLELAKQIAQNYAEAGIGMLDTPEEVIEFAVEECAFGSNGGIGAAIKSLLRISERMRQKVVKK
jgi:hypothetical protein